MSAGLYETNLLFLGRSALPHPIINLEISLLAQCNASRRQNMASGSLSLSDYLAERVTAQSNKDDAIFYIPWSQCTPAYISPT